MSFFEFKFYLATIHPTALNLKINKNFDLPKGELARNAIKANRDHGDSYWLMWKTYNINIKPQESCTARMALQEQSGSILRWADIASIRPGGPKQYLYGHRPTQWQTWKPRSPAPAAWSQPKDLSETTAKHFCKPVLTKSPVQTKKAICLYSGSWTVEINHWSLHWDQQRKVLEYLWHLWLLCNTMASVGLPTRSFLCQFDPLLSLNMRMLGHTFRWQFVSPYTDVIHS